MQTQQTQIQEKIFELIKKSFTNKPSNPNLLKIRLKEFGLSPVDWDIVCESEKYRIINVDTPDFQFVGYANQAKTRWESLTLSSL